MANHALNVKAYVESIQRWMSLINADRCTSLHVNLGPSQALSIRFIHMGWSGTLQRIQTVASAAREVFSGVLSACHLRSGWERFQQLSLWLLSHGLGVEQMSLKSMSGKSVIGELFNNDSDDDWYNDDCYDFELSHLDYCQLLKMVLFSEDHGIYMPSDYCFQSTLQAFALTFLLP